MQTSFMPASTSSGRQGRFIFIASPLLPVGGGMYKVADLLLRSQTAAPGSGAMTLRPLETRGGGSAVASAWVLLGALIKLARARLGGGLAGVHVNMAERLSLVRKSIIVMACRVLGVPVVLHLHAVQLHHNYEAMPAVLKAMVRWVFSLPAGVVVLGRTSMEFVTGQLQVPAHRVQIVINGVPGPPAVRTPGRSHALKKVLFVGNLSERKGVSDLLRALASPQLRDMAVEATFAGGGDLAGYRAVAARLGLGDRVRVAGWASSQVVSALLEEADALVLPSYDEGLPLVILEALAHGVAVVCTPVGEIPHVFTDGVDAFFVKAGDQGSIAQGLQRVLSDDPLREALERNGRAIYERQFSLARFCAAIADVHKRHFGICGSGLPQDDPVQAGRGQ